MKKLLITSIFYLFLFVNIFAQCNPNAGLDDAICGNTYTFSATLGDINSTGTWSTNASGVVFSNINDPNALVTVLSYQSIEFYWTEDNTIIPCTNVDTVIITFIEIPVANAGIDDQVCGLSANLTGSFSSGNTGFWTSSPAGAIFTPVNSPTATVTVPGYGIYIFTWEEDNNLCTSTDDVVVEFLQTPNANAGIDQTVCGLFVNLDATISFLGNTGYWSGPANFSDIYDPDATANITNIPGTQITHTLYWYETNGVCSGTTDSVEITFIAPPIADAGNGGSTCDSSYILEANAIGITPDSVLWTSNTPGLFVFAPSSDTTIIDITPIVPGIYSPNGYAEIYMYFTVYDGTCSSTDSVLITFYQAPIAYAGIDDSICGLYYDLNAIPSILSSYGEWSVISCPTAAGPANLVDFNNPQTGVNVPVYGYWTFQWEEANDNNFTCFSRDTVTINFIEIPNIDAGPRDTVCGYFVELNATSAGGIGTWLNYGVVWCTSNNLSTADTLQQNESNTWVYYNTLNDSIAFVWQECDGFCCNIDTVWILFEEYININGNVLYNLNPLNPGDAEIELFNINSGNYELNDISSIAGNNIFNLQGNKSGDYILKANVLNHISYPDAMNTYYDDAFLWENAQIFTLSCGDSINADINLKRTIAFTPGSGKVSGSITYEGSGNPVTDAVFFIEDTTVNDPYLYTDVNINGYYQFIGLPQGNFRILVDLSGIPQITTHNFSVTATNTLFENYDYYVDTILYRETGIGIYADTAATYNIDNPQLNVSLISVYPNPFKNNINLEYKLEQNSIVEIQVIDITGKIIHKQSVKSLDSGNYSESIEIADKGVYFLVVSINKNTYIKKIVSQ